MLGTEHGSKKAHSCKAETNTLPTLAQCCEHPPVRLHSAQLTGFYAESREIPRGEVRHFLGERGTKLLHLHHRYLRRTSNFDQGTEKCWPSWSSCDSTYSGRVSSCVCRLLGSMLLNYSAAMGVARARGGNVSAKS